MKMYIWILGFVLCCGQAIAEQQKGYTVKETTLFAEASSISTHVLELKKGVEVRLLKRSGGWYQVETGDKKQGWLKMLSVRFDTEQGAKTTNLSSLVNVQAASGSGVATGIRGMSDEELDQEAEDTSANVTPLVRLQRFSPNKTEVRVFAAEAGLHRQHVDYINVKD